MAERLVLYHGTTDLIALLVERGSDLFGFHDLTQETFSGNLTRELDSARRWALHRARRQYDDPRLITVAMAVDEIIPVGDDGHGFTAYATTFTVDPSCLPDRYLFGLLGSGLSREEATRNVNGGYMRFYRVPNERVISIDELL